MRPSIKKYLALLVTFVLLASLSGQAFNAHSFAHELDHERHELSAFHPHSHFVDSHETSEHAPMDGMQHLALHAMGDIQPIVLSAFAHTLVAPVSNVTPPSCSSVAPALPDREPPFRPPQSV